MLGSGPADEGTLYPVEATGEASRTIGVILPARAPGRYESAAGKAGLVMAAADGEARYASRASQTGTSRERSRNQRYAMSTRRAESGEMVIERADDEAFIGHLALTLRPEHGGEVLRFTHGSFRLRPDPALW